MPIFTHRYIKEKAQDILDCNSITRPPVDVRKIAKDLELEIVEMTQDAWFYGMLLGIHDDCYIVVNKLLPEAKKRFTIAHELGHHQLHRADMTESSSKEKEYTHKEADIFASELLMPMRMIKRHAAEWYNDHKVLAELFGVTEIAMLEKLDELGLIQKTKFSWDHAATNRIWSF